MLPVLAGLAALFALLPAEARPRAPSAPIRLTFVGDVSLAARPLPRDRTALAEAANPLAAFAPLFRSVDLAVANLEGVLGARDPSPYREERLNLWAPPDWAAIFAPAGVGLVGTANNHAFDGGAAGVAENRDALLATGVAVHGTGATADEATLPHRLERHGACVSIVPATLKLNKPAPPGAFVADYRGERLADLLTLVRAEKAACRFVVVSVHWGRENVHTPPADVQTAARALAEAGADVVVGHHPHVLQGAGFIGDTAVAYSLGNFVFTNRTEAKRVTAVLEVTLPPDGPPRMALHPAVIRLPAFRPEPATPAEAARLLERMKAWSAPLGGEVSLEGGLLVVRQREGSTQR